MKKISSILIALFLLAALCMPAFAVSDDSNAELYYITDAADILSDSEDSALEAKAQQLSLQYRCSIYIVTVDDFRDYTNSDDPYDAATAIYTEYNLGWGEDQDGIMLILSMDERDYALAVHGYGETAFTSYGLDLLSDKFLDDFSDNDWYDGFSDYLDECGVLLQSARAGEPVDASSNPLIRVAGIAISIVIGVVIAALICFGLANKMNSVASKSEADAYLHAGSVNYTVRDDRFTHTTQTREKIEKSSSKSGGGFSGKSGKF